MCRKVWRIAILYPAVGGCENFKFAAVRDARNCRHATSGNYAYLEYLNYETPTEWSDALDLNRIRLAYDLYRDQNLVEFPLLSILRCFFFGFGFWREENGSREQRHRNRDTRYLNKIVRAQFSQSHSPLMGELNG